LECYLLAMNLAFVSVQTTLPPFRLPMQDAYVLGKLQVKNETSYTCSLLTSLVSKWHNFFCGAIMLAIHPDFWTPARGLDWGKTLNPLCWDHALRAIQHESAEFHSTVLLMKGI
jgi:hypothetical protein